MGFNDYIENYGVREDVATKEEKGNAKKHELCINWPKMIDDVSDWLLRLAIIGVCIKFIFKGIR